MHGEDDGVPEIRGRITPAVVEALAQHRLRQGGERAKVGKSWHENDLVFCNTRGEYFHPAHLYTMFQQLLKEAELSPIRFHDLRHSAATILMAMGIHVKVIQELLGHSNIALTLNIYGHALPSMQAEASEKWDDLFGGQDEKAMAKLKVSSRSESSSDRPPEDYQERADSFFNPGVWLLLVPLDSLSARLTIGRSQSLSSIEYRYSL